jgi:hypothetical protein
MKGLDMDEKMIAENLAEEMVGDWTVTPTGSGFVVETNWQWPSRERIEIYVRAVGEREDLFIVSDGGELFNCLFSQGIDLTKDEPGMKVLHQVAENYESKFVDYQLVKGANEEEMPRAIRMILEAIKDASLILWHKVEKVAQLH